MADHQLTQFDPGKTCQLKSGGPWMTIVKRDADMVYVSWFDGDDQLHHSHFLAVTLRPDTRSEW